MAAGIRITGGNFRLLDRLLSQTERVGSGSTGSRLSLWRR